MWTAVRASTTAGAGRRGTAKNREKLRIKMPPSIVMGMATVSAFRPAGVGRCVMGNRPQKALVESPRWNVMDGVSRARIRAWQGGGAREGEKVFRMWL